jgi:pSer/pThr/pTyr-binding forkhead associated (FHA) protein
MAKLILSLDGQTVREYLIDKERITIGRRPSNDIQIDNLAVSGEHAVITTILNDSFLEDMDSTNGTLVNGEPVKKHYLQNDDVIEIGKYRLTYFTGQAAVAPEAEPQDFERTMIIRSSPLGAKTAPVEEPVAASHANTQPVSRYEEVRTDEEEPAPAPAAAAVKPEENQPVAAIQILTGANAGKELELTKTLTSLGKPGVQVAVITRRPQGYFITHVQGENFPMVNGQTLDAQAHVLNDHDVIELAGIKMEFFFK